MKFKIYYLVALLLFCSLQVYATLEWKAKWISYPQLKPDAYAVLNFRNSFSLAEVPGKLPLSISADIRYKLYVNGTYVGQGPANNDQRHYIYDEQDIAKYLRVGENVVAVTVFSLSDMNPLRYESTGAKLIVHTDDPLGEVLNTGSGDWKVNLNQAYSPTHREKDFRVLGYFAMGGGEKIVASQYPWGWKSPDYSDAGWKKAEATEQAEGYGNKYTYGGADLSLQPRTIPAMDESSIERPVLRSTADKLSRQSVAAWSKNKPVIIPANTKTTLLLDQTYLTKGHPFFTFSGGRNAEVRVSYAETLFIDFESKLQGHRDSIEGK